jgi:hypothetical protein
VLSALCWRPQRSRHSPPHRCERAERCCREATRQWRVHLTVGAHASEGLQTAPLARFPSLHWVAHRSVILAVVVSSRVTQRRGKGKSELGFGIRASSTSFDRAQKPRGHRMRLGGRDSLDHLSGPSVHESFLAQAHQSAIAHKVSIAWSKAVGQFMFWMLAGQWHFFLGLGWTWPGRPRALCASGSWARVWPFGPVSSK